MSDRDPTPPAEGERRAVSGYRGQYSVAAVILLNRLKEGQLEAIRIADPEAGRVDDFLCLSPQQVDAFQVKWGVFPGRLTFNDLSNKGDGTQGLIRDLAEGWQRLRARYPGRTVRVHLVSSDIPHAEPGAFLPNGDVIPSPHHFAAFISEAWPTKRDRIRPVPAEWQPALARLRQTSGLTDAEFEVFSTCCHFDLNFSVESPLLTAGEIQSFELDRAHIAGVLFNLVGDPHGIIELSTLQLLVALGWDTRAAFRNPHSFPVDLRYEPIDETVNHVRARIDTLDTGYVALVGAPGSGKSTLLTECLRDVDALVVSYYAFVPEAATFGPIRGEAESFLHDLSLALQQRGLFGDTASLPPSDVNALRSRIGKQLAEAGDAFLRTGRKTIVLVDGLDHIEREQKPRYSLLDELPLPASIPKGVLFVLGSQRTDFLKPAIKVMLRQDKREIQVQPMSRASIQRVVERASLPHALDARQMTLLVDRANGHPLALAYLLNQLTDARDPSAIEQVLNSDTRYQGNVELLYSSHWDEVADDVAVMTLLGHVCRWDGPFDTNWFATWHEAGSVDRLLRHFRHFLRHESGTRWTLFHNSFRLFLLDRTAENALHQHDPSRETQYHRELAQACVASEDPWTRALALRHWYRSGEHDKVLAMATQRLFRDECISLRPIHLITHDIDLSIRSAVQTGNPECFARSVLAGFEIQQRGDSLRDFDIPSHLFAADRVEAALAHLRDGTRLNVSRTGGLAWALTLRNAGHLDEARRLFELSEPLELLRSQRPIEGGLHEEPSELLEWAETAVHFREPGEVLKTIGRIRRAPSGGLREDTEEASTKRLRAQMLQRAGKAALKLDDHETLKAVDGLLDFKDAETVEAGIQFLLDACTQYAARGRRDTSREVILHALDRSRRWRLPLGLVLDLADAAYEYVRDVDLLRDLVAGVEQPPIDEHVAHSQDQGVGNLRFRLNRLLTFLGQEADPDTVVPDPRSDHQEATVRLARAHCRLANVWGLAWRGVRLHPGEVADRCLPLLHLFDTSNDRRQHRHGWYQVLGGRAAFFELVARASAAHGPAALERVVARLDDLWSRTDLRHVWTPQVRLSVLQTVVALGWNTQWAHAQLLRIDQQVIGGEATTDVLTEALGLAKAWRSVGECARSEAIVPLAVARALRPMEEKDYQIETWVGWVRNVNAADPGGARSRSEYMARLIRAMADFDGNVANLAAAELVQALWTVNPAWSTDLRRWFGDKFVLEFRNGVGAVLSAATDDQAVTGEDVLLIAVRLLGWDSIGRVPEAVERAAARLTESTAPAVAAFLNGAIKTDVSASKRADWLSAIRKGLAASGVESQGIPADPGPQSDRRHKQPALMLKDGTKLTGESLQAATSSFEGFIDTLRQAQLDHYESDIDLEPYLRNLTQSEVAQVSVVLHSSSVRSISTLCVASAFLRCGAREEAWLCASRVAEGLTINSWFERYDGGKKLVAVRLLGSIDPTRARTAALRLFEMDVSAGLQWYRDGALSLQSLLDVLFGEVSPVLVWPAIADYMSALLPEASEPPSGLALSRRTGSANTELGHLVHDACVHPAPILSRFAAKATIQGMCKQRPWAHQVVATVLSEDEDAVDLGLAILQATMADEPAAINQWKPTVQKLCTSGDLSIRTSALGIADAMEWQIPAQSHKALPAIYGLALPNQPGLIVPDATIDPTEALRDTTNPESLMGHDAPLIQLLADATGIARATLLRRGVELMHMIKPEEMWNAKAETQLRRRLQVSGVNLSFRRPRGRVVHRATRRMAAELLDADRIKQQYLPLLERICSVYDPSIYSLDPVERPLEVSRFELSEHGYLSSSGWLDKVSVSTALPPRLRDGRVVLAESTDLTWLDHHMPREARRSGVWLEAHEAVEASVVFDSQRFTTIDDYIEADVSGRLAAMAMRFWGYEPLVTEGWLAIDPRLAFEMKWSLADNGLFRWLDAHGDVAVESLFWSDGVIQLQRPSNAEEVGSGWIVLASNKAFEELRRRWGALIRRRWVKRSMRNDEAQEVCREASVSEPMN